MQLSNRCSRLHPPSTIAMSARARELKAKGVDVVAFGQGEPDFDTPDKIKQAAIKALLAGQTKYMPTLGDPETLAVIAGKFTRENGIPDCTAKHVAVSSGGRHSLFVVLQCLINCPMGGAGGKGVGEPQDEVLLPVPAWVSYKPIAELAGAKVVELPTTRESDFKLTAAQLRAAITPRTRVLIINSPSNPCGTMYTEAELRALADVVADAAASVAPNMVILTDEMYEKLVYGGIPHFSIGSIPKVAERTITVNGLSKTFAMTGWRVGYTGTSGAFGLKFIKAMSDLQGQLTTNITSFVYPAIRTALTECAAEVEQMRVAFARRAELIHSLVQQIPGLPSPRPTGAFYLFPEVSSYFGKRTKAGSLITSGTDFAEALLAENNVVVVPGEDFGGCGPKHIRFSFACSEENIRKGVGRLAEFCASVK